MRFTPECMELADACDAVRPKLNRLDDLLSELYEAGKLKKGSLELTPLIHSYINEVLAENWQETTK